MIADRDPWGYRGGKNSITAAWYRNLLPLRIQYAKFLGRCRIEKTNVSGHESHRLAELPAKSQRGRKVDGAA